MSVQASETLRKHIECGNLAAASKLLAKQDVHLNNNNNNHALELLRHVSRNVKIVNNYRALVSFLKLLQFNDLQEPQLLKYLKYYYVIVDYLTNEQQWTSIVSLQPAFTVDFITSKMSSEECAMYSAIVNKLTKSLSNEVKGTSPSMPEGQFIALIKCCIEMQAQVKRDDILYFMVRVTDTLKNHEKLAPVGICLLNSILDLNVDISSYKKYLLFVILLKCCLRNVSSRLRFEKSVLAMNEILQKLQEQVKGPMVHILDYLASTNQLSLAMWSENPEISSVIHCHQTVQKLYQVPELLGFIQEALLFCFFMQTQASNAFKMSRCRYSIKSSNAVETKLEYYMTHIKTQCNIIMRKQSTKTPFAAQMCCCSLFLSTRRIATALTTNLEAVVGIHNALKDKRFLQPSFYAKIASVVTQVCEFNKQLSIANCESAPQKWMLILTVISSVVKHLSNEKRHAEYLPIVEQVAQIWFSVRPDASNEVHHMLHILVHGLVQSERSDDAMDACALAISCNLEHSEAIFKYWNTLLYSTKMSISLWDVLKRKSKYLTHLCPNDKLEVFMTSQLKQELYILEIRYFIKKWKGSRLTAPRLETLCECIQQPHRYFEILRSIPCRWLLTLDLEALLNHPESYWQMESALERGIYHYFKFKKLYRTAMQRSETELKQWNEYLPWLLSTLKLFENCKVADSLHFLIDLSQTFDLFCLTAEARRALHAALKYAQEIKDDNKIIEIVGYLCNVDHDLDAQILLANKSLRTIQSTKVEAENEKQFEYMRCTFYCQLAKYYFRKDDVEGARTAFENATSAYYAFGGYLSSYDRKKILDEDMACAHYTLLMSYCEMVPCSQKFPSHDYSYDALLELVFRELYPYRKCRFYANFTSYLALFMEIIAHGVWKSWRQRFWHNTLTFVDIGIDCAQEYLLSYRLCQMHIAKAKLNLYQQRGNECKVELDRAENILTLKCFISSAEDGVEQLTNELTLNLHISSTSPVNTRIFRLPDSKQRKKCPSPCLTCCFLEYRKLQLQIVSLVGAWSEWRGDTKTAANCYQGCVELLKGLEDDKSFQRDDVQCDILWDIAQYYKRSMLFGKYLEMARQIRALLERKFLRNYFLYNEIVLDMFHHDNDVNCASNSLQRTPERQICSSNVGFVTPEMGQNVVNIKNTTPRRYAGSTLAVPHNEEFEERTKRLRKVKNLEAEFVSSENKTSTRKVKAQSVTKATRSTTRTLRD